MLTLWLALALTQASKPAPWVPADTDMADQTCGMDGHRHALDYDEKGHYVVNKQKGEPDIVFDGKCHDEHERVMNDPDRKVLPKPKKDL